MIDTKQVIVVRKDLKMNPGKLSAQVAHASMAFVTAQLQYSIRRAEESAKFVAKNRDNVLDSIPFEVRLSKRERDWLKESFAKVVLAVNSEEELDTIFQEAITAEITAYAITDEGRTAFHGNPTKTCIALGPDSSEKIDEITSHLKLYR